MFELLAGVKVAMHTAARRSRRLKLGGEPSCVAALMSQLCRFLAALRRRGIEEGRRLLRGEVNALGWRDAWTSAAGCSELFGAAVDVARRLALEQVGEDRRDPIVD